MWKTYGVLLALALGLPMFMLLMFMLPVFAFPCMFAFALFVLALLVLVLAEVAPMFALPAVFELSAVEQPAKRTVAVSKNRRAMVCRIEVPPVCIRYNGD
jgi:membrane protein implicated in regulation of membrane protease activity